MNTGIYIIESPSNKIYVGQSTNLAKRKKYYSVLKCEQQTKLYNSLKKYGWNSHLFQVIMPLKENISKEILNWYEQFFIDHYRSEGRELLNLREAGSRGKHSEETLIKLRLINKGKKRGPPSEETRRKIGLKHKGKIVSAETRLKSSLSHKGKKLPPELIAKLTAMRQNISQETRDKRSKSLTGRKRSPETIEKVRNKNIGKKRSSEIIQRIKQIVSNRTPETKLKMSISAKKRHEFNILNGNKINNSKLVPEQVRIIMHALQWGNSRIALSSYFNVTKQTISNIKTGRIWSQVTGIKNTNHGFSN